MKYQKKKFRRPLKPWSAVRIEHDAKLLLDYGLRRKHELLRAEAILRNFREHARQLGALKDKKQERVLLEKLHKLGLIEKSAILDDVLALTVENLLNRRLQTIIFKKGIAATSKQARQFIVHGHIALSGKRIRWPGMLVPQDEEKNISFYPKSKIKELQAFEGKKVSEVAGTA